METEEWDKLLSECQNRANPANAKLARGPLCSLYCERIYQFLRKRTQNTHLAEDLMQQTFAQLFTRMDRSKRDVLADPQQGFESYLFTIARNLFFAHIRSQAHTNENNKSMKQNTDMILNEADENPEKIAIEQDLRNRAYEAVEEPYCTPLRMRDQQGLKYEEIAESLSRPIDTIKTQIYRGRKQFINAYRRLGGLP